MLKRTALFDEHVRLGGKMVPFGGWEMPVQYTGVMDEHLACRTAAGLFDVSHMGEFILEGTDAESFLQYAVSNDISKIAVHQAQYTVMCNAQGGIVDDLVIYRQAADRFLIVVNAANIDKDFTHLTELHRARGVKANLTNDSAKYSQIAIQGPKAVAILQSLTKTDLSTIKTYWFNEGFILDSKTPAILARTGYTGEDGFEVYVAWDEGPRIWRALLEAGTSQGLKPCGLAARDTLRMEMKYPLYGNELTDETTPLEAGLGWVTKLAKGEFHGRAPIAAQNEKGIPRKLVGFQLIDRGVPRSGYSVLEAGGAKTIGTVTSGTHAPSLKLPIGIAYVEMAHAEIGHEILIQIRDQKLKAKIVETPFYKRPY